MLDAGLSQTEVARRFGVHPTTINRLVGRLRTTRSTDDRSRSGRQMVTSHIQDRYIRIRHLRHPFLTAESTAAGLPFPRRISCRTVLCRLAAVGIHPRRPYRGLNLTPNHLRQRVQWARGHVRRTIRRWGHVLFTDKSRFLLRHSNGCVRVFPRLRERFSDNCVMRHDRYGGEV